jgi:ubiquinol-cytochrome c reductase cytochrome b subunit
MAVWKRTLAWCIDRLGLGPVLQHLREHKVPAEIAGPKGWLYVFGPATLAAFILQLITGLGLVNWYIPSPAHAYESLQYLNSQVSLGWLVRGMHYFGASAMVVFVFIHAGRTFLTGSYKFPREMNWITGVFLGLLVTLMAYSGQLLRWDANGVWTVVVASKFVARIPLIGPSLSSIVLGGDSVSGITLSRFFALHVFVFPALLVAILGWHLYLVLHHGISEWPMAGRSVDPKTYREFYAKLKARGKTYWPNVISREALVTLIVIAGITALAFFLGPKGPDARPDPTAVRVVPKPDWFHLWYYALVWIKPRGAEALVMVYGPLLVFVGLLLVPLLAPKGERSPSRRPWAIVSVVVITLTFGALTVLGHKAPWVPETDNTLPTLPAALGSRPEVQLGLQTLHRRGCFACHTVMGHGGNFGPDLTQVGLRMDAGEITVRVINGRNDMPAYRDVIPADELNAMVVFLQALATPPEPR